MSPAREMGISDQTIYNWKKKAENGILFLMNQAARQIQVRIEELPQKRIDFALFDIIILFK